MSHPKRIRTVEGSCLKCKSRRVKCDLKKPCTKCVAGNFQCIFGKQIKFQIVEPLSLKEKSRIKEKVQHSLPVLFSPKITCDQQFMYFEKILSPKLTMLGSSLKVNGGIFQDPLLTNFIEAVSNAHKLISSNDYLSHDVVKSSRTSAISEFRQKIIELSKENMNVLFAGNVLLCLLDGVIDPKDDNTMAYMHLKGGRAILTQMGSPERQLETLSDPISIMMLSYFGTIDLINCVLTGAKPHYGKEFWLIFGGKEAWWGNIRENDAFLQILGELSEIAQAPLNAETVIDIAQIISSLSFFERETKRNCHCCVPWDLYCSLFSLSGLIYVYRMICGFPIEHALVQKAVSDCVQNIIELKNSDLQHCLLFPLLIVGYHSIEAQHQEVIRQSVVDSYNHLTFGNVRVLWKFLESKWYGKAELEKSEWCTDFSTISETVFLF